MLSKFHICLASLLAAGLLLLLAPGAKADPIPPGSLNVPVPIVPGGTVSGSIVADTGSLPFSFAATTGTARELVIRDANNPFGAGDLTFAYQVQVATGLVEHLTAFDYSSAMADVAQEVGPQGPFVTGTNPAANADRVTARTISFNFTGILGGQNSYIEYIRTDATTLGLGTIGVIDGGGQTLEGFAPTAVPEPTMVVLLSSACVFGSGAFLRRRFFKRQS